MAYVLILILLNQDVPVEMFKQEFSTKGNCIEAGTEMDNLMTQKKNRAPGTISAKTIWICTPL